MGRAVGHPHRRAVEVIDPFAEVEDHAEQAVWRNVGPALPAQVDRWSDPVDLVAVSLKPAVGQRSRRGPGVDRPAGQGEAVGRNGDAVRVLVAGDDRVAEHLLGGRAGCRVDRLARLIAHFKNELRSAAHGHGLTERQRHLNGLANGVPAVLSWIGRDGNPGDGGAGGLRLSEPGRNEDQEGCD